jgi:DNA-binding transcriptional LysR family regulator
LLEYEDIKHALSHAQNQIGGILRIGTSHHIGLHHLPSILKQYVQQYPEVQLDVHFVDSEQAHQAVLSGELELAFLTLPPQFDARLNYQPLWHVMLEFPLQYQQLCQQTLGRYLNHRPYADNRFYADNSISSRDEQAQQLCHAWRYSCILNGVNPSTTTMLPRLFAIDAALEWPSAQIYELEQLKQQYRQYLKNQSNSSGSSGCSSCSSCGGD